MSTPRNIRIGEVLPNHERGGKNGEIAKPSCGGQAGGWVCVTCRPALALRNNLEANAHDPGHVLGWRCPDHGIESVDPA